MRSIFYILIAFLLFAFGCDVFETRNPEEPSQTKSNYNIPSEPQILIQNIINSFSDKNADNYKKSFALGPPLSDKTFYFSPSSFAVSRFPGKWTDWSADDEYEYFVNLVTNVPDEFPVSLFFSKEIYSPQGDSVIYTAEYSLSVPKSNNEPDIYEGNIKFSMITNNQSVWVIYFWEDIAKEGFESWSELKGENHL